jgi:hypothetical protein
MSGEGKVLILRWMIGVLADSPTIRAYIEECMEEATELRKERVEVVRERRRLAVEREAWEKKVRQEMEGLEVALSSTAISTDVPTPSPRSASPMITTTAAAAAAEEEEDEEGGGGGGSPLSSTSSTSGTTSHWNRRVALQQKAAARVLE